MQIRDARADDVARLAEIYRLYVDSSAVSFEAVAPDGDAMSARMLTAPRLPWLVAEDGSGAVVGYAYATGHRERAAYRWAVDCSVYLTPDARRRGTGRHLYSTLLPLLRDLGYRQACAGIAMPNQASVGLHEAMGFTPVGVYKDIGYKLGRWHDVGWWQLLLKPATAEPPEEPQPWRPANEG